MNKYSLLITVIIYQKSLPRRNSLGRLKRSANTLFVDKTLKLCYTTLIR